MNKLTVRELKWILAAASEDATIPEALQELADAERRQAADLEHAERLGLYNEYVARRREREHEAVQGAYDAAKQASINSGPISRDRLHAVSAEAADLERLRFEIREPYLSFEEWIDAGSPDVHQIRAARDVQAKRVDELAAGAVE